VAVDILISDFGFRIADLLLTPALEKIRDPQSAIRD
jgi:hypothetical protein